jgi:hypothetical protein
MTREGAFPDRLSRSHWKGLFLATIERHGALTGWVWISLDRGENYEPRKAK